MKNLHDSTIRNIIFAIAINFISNVHAEQANSKFFEEKLSEISQACKDQGYILAEAKINKWKKEGQNIEDRLGKDAYKIVSKIMHQQCISIQSVALLRFIKSTISTKEALQMDIDGEISRQMDIIEKTL